MKVSCFGDSLFCSDWLNSGKGLGEFSKWEEKRLEDIIDVNPPVKLKKGESYPFIDIDKVSPIRRSVTNEDVKIYDRQRSSKFCDGDTVFSRIMPYLEKRKIAKVAIDSEVAFVSTEFYVFRAKKRRKQIPDSLII